ncbi:MAG TPA: hypothetical protein VF704_09380 [Allosphingosinicella sp.]|jgi:hypothetical protein
MRTLLILAAAAALAGCDMSFSAGGGNAGNAASANASTDSGNGSASAAPANAGLTNSRSLAGLGGNNGGSGGKDPAAGATPAASGSIDPQLLLGRWTDDGDCKRDIDFRPDGTFRSYTGGEGSWTLAGNVLTLSGQGGTFRLQLQALDGNTMETLNEQGARGRSTRC